MVRQKKQMENFMVQKKPIYVWDVNTDNMVP